MPTGGWITSDTNKENTNSKIAKVLVVDESGLAGIMYEDIKEERYKNTTFVYKDETLSELENQLAQEDKETIIMHISQEEGFYQFHFVKPQKGKVSESEIHTFADDIIEYFEQAKLNSLDISKEQDEKLNEPIRTKVQVYTGGLEEVEEGFGITMSEYNIIIGILVIIIMLFSYGGEGIASSIVTEKSTKVVEILLIKIESMALIVGKVFAMLTVTLLQLLLIITSLIFSSIIYRTFFVADGSFLPSVIANVLEPSLFENVTIINIILALIFYVAGFIFYGFFAGLAGATVSKIEELSEGILLFTFLLLIGSYIGLAVPIMNLSQMQSQVYANFAFLFPLSSMFITPIYLMFGKVSQGIALLAIGILIVSIIILVGFTGKVYQTLILHQGNKVKIKDLIFISRQRKEQING